MKHCIFDSTDAQRSFFPPVELEGQSDQGTEALTGRKDKEVTASHGGTKVSYSPHTTHSEPGGYK